MRFGRVLTAAAVAGLLMLAAFPFIVMLPGPPAFGFEAANLFAVVAIVPIFDLLPGLFRRTAPGPWHEPRPRRKRNAATVLPWCLGWGAVAGAVVAGPAWLGLGFTPFPFLGLRAAFGRP